jgi:hypothetical protein
MLFDFEHVDQAENTNPGGAKNVRATCWEIHPVTAIKVLDQPPPASFRLAPEVVRAFQQAQAAQINGAPKRRQFVDERLEKYRQRMGEDGDGPENGEEKK